VKLAMTLLVRDERDIVDAHLSFHLNAGVDLVIATDHCSTDGTTEILESYERDGYVHLIRRQDSRIQQSAWVTHMARQAATEHGADWVINSDADEFWWPREGSLKEVLQAVPAAYGVVRAVSRVFIPRPGAGWFAERMTARLALSAPINDPATPFRHVAKAAHRAHPDAVVQQGNHDVTGVPYADLSNWSPIEVLHFPLRSADQAARKHETTWTAWLHNLRGDLARAKRSFEEGRPEAFFDRVAVADVTVRRGVQEGSLVEDFRLRDALRALRDGSGSFVPPGSGNQLNFGLGSLAEDVSRVVDRALLEEADGVRLQRRADELAARIAGRSGAAVYGYARS
jgi:glycosyltransferase involved in cell wall biosynthesis